ncbi:MAG: DUF6377 domain-containing protein [Chitinophagales bacterium]
MLKKLTILCVFLYFNNLYLWSQTNIDSLLIKLDQTIQQRDTYIAAKQLRINGLKKQLENPQNSSIEIYQLNDELYEEYKKYNFDSALHYIYANLNLAPSFNGVERMIEAKLDLSAILTTTGMPHESIETMQTIQKNQLKEDWLYYYYYTYKQAYQKLYEYTLNEKYAPDYHTKTKLYQDSLLQSVPFDSDSYLLEAGFLAFEEGRLQEAERIYVDLCEHRLTFGTAFYARAAGTLASIYERKGESSFQKKYLILSAISDIQAVVKENASLTSLAILLYQEGQINRANKYIEYALEDANFYNARLRKIEISKVYPIIKNAYELQIKKQKNELSFALAVITAISILLIIALAYIYLQMRKLAYARKNLYSLNQELEQANGQLSELNHALQLTNHQLNESNQQLNESNRRSNELNQELQQSNVRLNEVNNQLQEANYIKEEYIGHFLNQCAAYIDKLENYRKIVRNKMLTKQYSDLVKLTEPNAFIKSELRDFYTNFDNAFLRLYPDFVEKFNALLEEDKKIPLKKGELLNTELRIFALIRLGISDSNKIANFLRYSVNTIYNYRAKIKNKSAVERERFEEYVMEIGAL